MASSDEVGGAEAGLSVFFFFFAAVPHGGSPPFHKSIGAARPSDAATRPLIYTTTVTLRGRATPCRRSVTVGRRVYNKDVALPRLIAIAALLHMPAFVFAQAANPAPPIFPLKDVRAGQHGVGRTVFAGTKVEEFQVEILGVLDR